MAARTLRKVRRRRVTSWGRAGDIWRQRGLAHAGVRVQSTSVDAGAEVCPSERFSWTSVFDGSGPIRRLVLRSGRGALWTGEGGAFGQRPSAQAICTAKGALRGDSEA